MSEGDPLVGTVLAGRYRIVRHLGEGAMGAVYLAEHLKFGRMDAIKVLREKMANEEEATDRFLRGARNASRINHEHVCTVYDFSDAEGGIQFLAMEYVEGETLSETLEREGPMPAERAIPLVRQVASALAAAHDLGIIHRDLKPGNVMLTRGPDGVERVKVVDFDIAKGTAEGEGHEVTRMGFVVGTPEYMSPEQLIGDPLDGRSDLYSLGVVFFRMLSGSLPSRATNTQDLMVERLTQDPLTLAEVAPERDFPRTLQPLLDRLLRRKRDERIGSARELVREMESLRSTPAPATRAASVSAPPPSLPPSATTSGGVPRLAWVGLGGLAVAAVAALAFLGGDDTSTPTESDDPPLMVEDDPAPREEDPAPPVPDSSGPVDDEVDERDPEPVPIDPPDPGPPAIPLERAGDVLLRQLDSLVFGSGGSALVAAEDTARIVWDLPGLGARNRGLAAYVLGSARAERGDTADAVQWLRRALEADPEQRGARTLLEQIGGAA